MNNKVNGLDYNEVNRIFDEIFGSATYLESSVLDKYTKDYVVGQDSGLDFSELTEEDRKKIEQHFKMLRYEYLKDDQQFINDIKEVNADFSKYMNMYASSVVDDDLNRKIISGVINSIDYNEDVPKNIRGDYAKMTEWLQSDFINAIEAIDDEEVRESMAQVLNDATLSLEGKTDLYNSIIQSLMEQLGEGSENNPIVLWFEAKIADEGKDLANATSHILPGVVQRDGEDRSLTSARARSWVSRLTPDQVKGLANVHIDPGTINSFEDLLALLDQTAESIGKFSDIGALLSSGGNATNSTSWSQIKDDLVGMAQAGKLDETTLKDYEYYNTILEALGISADKADEQISSMIDSINSMAQQNAVDVLNKYKTGIDNLDAAYQKFKKGEFIDASTLSAIQDTFGDLDSYQEFEEAVMRGEENLQEYFDNIVTEYAIQESALGELTEANKDWVKQQLIASGITEESADKAIKQSLERKASLENEIRSTLELMNAEVSEKKGRDDLVVSTENLDKLTAQEIVLLMQEANMSGEAAQAVALFALKKELAKDSALRNQDDINYLLQLINLADLGGKKVTELKYKLENQQRYQEEANALSQRETEFYKKHGNTGGNYSDPGVYQEWKAIQNQKDYLDNWLGSIDTLSKDVLDEIYGQHPELDYTVDLDLDYGGAVDSATEAGSAAGEAFKEALDKILAMYDAELDAGVVAFQTYVDKSRAIIEQYYREGKITASEYYDYIASLYEKQVSEYDKVISAVQRKIREEVEGLEKEKETIEETYNLQIEEIQKKIDSLQEENEEIDRNIALQKAQ